MQTIRTETVQIGDSSIVFSVAGEIDQPALLLLHGFAAGIPKAEDDLKP